MKFRAVPAVCICLLCATTSGARNAPTQQSIEAKLQGPFVMLRGMWDGDNLHFDSQGNLTDSTPTLPFSLSAVGVDKIRLTDSELEIEGRREGLEFIRAIRAVSYKSARKIHISIAVDSHHPEALDAAVAKVFSIGVDKDLATSAPEYWQRWLRPLLGLPGLETVAGIDHPGGGVTPPRLAYAPDPKFTEPARELKYRGIVVVGLVVDAEGRPAHVHIVRPLGMGLDEQAVETVSHYQFTAATFQGKPVPVEINIEVNFRIN